MGYDFYQLMLFFSIYCIAGWLINVSFYMLETGSFDNRGVSRGPAMISCGIGAMVVLLGQQYMLKNIDIAFAGGYLAATFLLSLVTALVLSVSGLLIVNGLCGEKLARLRWYQPLLWALSGLVLVYHLHPLVEVVTKWISPWVHMIFLVIFWLNFVPGLIDGLCGLAAYRRKAHL